MLYRDTKARFEKTGVWIFSRYYFASGKVTARSMSRAAYDRLRQASKEGPVTVMEDPSRRRTWWLFAGETFWEDDGYDEHQMKALIMEKMVQRSRRANRAISLMKQKEAGVRIAEPARRQPIPPSVRDEVWERDGGCCVECGSDEALQFDHVIPVHLGGANSPENLQLLCADCNQAKSAALS